MCLFPSKSGKITINVCFKTQSSVTQDENIFELYLFSFIHKKEAFLKSYAQLILLSDLFCSICTNIWSHSLFRVFNSQTWKHFKLEKKQAAKKELCKRISLFHFISKLILLGGLWQLCYIKFDWRTFFYFYRKNFLIKRLMVMK